ncbi:carboxymuconolactone decarboxylase family protein [Planotetraspora silvatica]|nr:carboxymuconolactone decarboxylase family protein [Planotetraspora silvatica]
MNVAAAAPKAYQSLYGLERFLRESALPQRTLHLVKLRASQINGCAFCVEMHSHEAKKEGETDERLFTVAAWRDAPFYTDAERAALALTEASTRLSDRPDPVPDEVWQEAAEHYDEESLAALVVAIAAINAWNRISVTTRAVPGSYR